MGTDRFLWVQTLQEPQQRAKLDELRRGALLIERLEMREEGKLIAVPGGLVHHWMGVVFVPGATVDRALGLLQDYDHHADFYRPAVARSKLLVRNGDDFHVFLRFFTKKVITVVVNSEHDAHFVREGPGRARSRIYSTRIAEVENPDTLQEREKPVGRDGGYVWRLYTYWRFLEGEDGTYLQCESLTLTRSIPVAFGWLIRPFVTSIRRESLEFTLETTRKALTR
jgi:hypothetical protein